MSFKQWIEYFSALCHIGPPPLSTLPQISKEEQENLKSLETMKISMSNLATLMNEDQDTIRELTKQIDKEAPKFRTLGMDNNIYENKSVGAKVAQLVSQRLTLQKKYDARKIHYDNIQAMITVYEQTKDTVVMKSILEQGNTLIKNTIQQAGGIAAIKDSMEETSQMIFDANTVNSISQTPLSSSLPSSSSSIQVDVLSPDNSELKDILFQELNKYPAISIFPQAPSTSPHPTRPVASSSKKKLQSQVQGSPPVLLRKKKPSSEMVRVPV